MTCQSHKELDTNRSNPSVEWPIRIAAMILKIDDDDCHEDSPPKRSIPATVTTDSFSKGDG